MGTKPIYKRPKFSASEIDLTKFDLKVWMVCLMHPFVFLVGGDDWEGLQVTELLEDINKSQFCLLKDIKIDTNFSYNWELLGWKLSIPIIPDCS